MRPFVLLLFFLPFFGDARSQTVNRQAYKQRIAVIQKNINRFFYDSVYHRYKEFNYRSTSDKNEWSYLWPLCALIQAANEVEATGLSNGFFDDVLRHIHEYTDTTPPAKGYASYLPSVKKEARFYDDNQWIGIACMDAYNRTKNKSYLAEGEAIYRFMMTGFDTAAGGGLYWKEGDHTTKNTCSNGPGVLMALHLYKATGNKNYLDTALLIYNWVNKHLLSPKDVYYDNLHLPEQSIDKRTYTYNTGAMLQAAVLLYEALDDKVFLDLASRLAEGAYRQFFKKNHWPDNDWFNAVLLRGYKQFEKYTTEKKYTNSFQLHAEQLWRMEIDANSLERGQQKKSLIQQAALLEIFARLLK